MRALRSCAWNSRSLLPALASVKDIEMADSTHYVIRGGLEGRERLRVPLLKQGGFEDVGVAITQPVGTEGEVKLLNPLTMENIASAVLADGLASQHEIDEVVRELYDFATDPNTVAGTPRVVQAWGRRPTA